MLHKPSDGITNKVSKNPKRGDWEAELRAEIEKKRGSATKLSAKEQALVDQQLLKESTVRSKIEDARQTVSCGLGIAQNLINIPSGLGLELWFYKVLTILLGGVVQKCGAFVGAMAVYTFLVQEPRLDSPIEYVQGSGSTNWSLQAFYRRRNTAEYERITGSGRLDGRGVNRY